RQAARAALSEAVARNADNTLALPRLAHTHREDRQAERAPRYWPHALAKVYHDFARALLDSQRPAGLSGVALDEYNLLLEDQAYPLEEQAIDLYEANLRRIPQGVWNDAVRASWQALQDLVPARYERRTILEDRYEALR
ncbi:MAG: hypothetical protein RLN67_12530, partial [Algiphilus sp.]